MNDTGYTKLTILTIRRHAVGIVGIVIVHSTSRIVHVVLVVCIGSVRSTNPGIVSHAELVNSGCPYGLKLYMIAVIGGNELPVSFPVRFHPSPQKRFGLVHMACPCIGALP